jgi:hypothetical protein
LGVEHGLRAEHCPRELARRLPHAERDRPRGLARREDDRDRILDGRERRAVFADGLGIEIRDEALRQLVEA